MNRLMGLRGFFHETFLISGNLVDLSEYTHHFSRSFIFLDLSLFNNSEMLNSVKVKHLKNFQRKQYHFKFYDRLLVQYSQLTVPRYTSLNE